MFLVSVSLHAYLFQFLFLIVHFCFYFLTVMFLSIFVKTPKFCCDPVSVCLECSSTFCFPGLAYCSSVAALLAFRHFRSNSISFPASHCTFPFLSLQYLCTFQFHFHKRTFCVPLRYFYGVILLFLVIPRLIACAFPCFTVGPSLRSAFVFLFHTTGTPFIIR